MPKHKRIRNNSGSHQERSVCKRKTWDFRFDSPNCNPCISWTTSLLQGIVFRTDRVKSRGGRVQEAYQPGRSWLVQDR
jgi:hypothetical protein